MNKPNIERHKKLTEMARACVEFIQCSGSVYGVEDSDNPGVILNILSTAIMHTCLEARKDPTTEIGAMLMSAISVKPFVDILYKHKEKEENNDEEDPDTI